MATPARRRTRFDLGSGLVAVGLVLVGPFAGCTHRPVDPAERARRLHFDAIVVDGHADTTPRFEDPSWSFTERHDLADGTVDLPRMREGGLDVQFWSIYMGPRETKGEALREALERIDAVHELAARHPDDLVVAGSVAQIRAAVAAGKVVSLMGIEGGHVIEESLPALRDFHRLGVRYLTLTHAFNTTWADSSGTTETPAPTHGGLTDFGRRVVLELNRIGMLVDVSHVSDATFFDALATTRAPVIASHSATRAVANHPRNLSDAMLRALAENGGVAMINFYPVYIDEDAAARMRAYFAEHAATLAAIQSVTEGDHAALAARMRDHFARHPAPRTSLDVLLDHFDHAIAVAGPDHVGIGADWDGVASMPVGMEDVSRLPALTAGLLARGHDEATVRKVLGENLLRVLAEAERVSAAMRADERERVDERDPVDGP
ncbi:MAG: dipeptidase [Myxococcota bacterium]